MFDFDPDGRSLIMGCGAEVLVHDGGTEGPLWRTELPDLVLAVASAADHVVAVSAAGTTQWYEPLTGDVVAEHTASAATAAAVRADGAVALGLADRVVVVLPDGQEERSLPVAGASHLAFDRSGRLAIAAGAELQVLDAEGATVQEVTFDEAVVAIAGGPDWFAVAAGRQVKRAGTSDEVVPHLTSAPPEMAVTALGVRPDGARVALVLDGEYVMVLTLPGRETVGQIRYLDRLAVGVAFGPGYWLGIGLDSGDGNKIDLQSGATHRTDTQPGRQHTSWMLTVTADDGGATIPPPRAGPASVGAEASSGGAHSAPQDRSPLVVALVMVLTIGGISLAAAIMGLMGLL